MRKFLGQVVAVVIVAGIIGATMVASVTAWVLALHVWAAI